MQRHYDRAVRQGDVILVPVTLDETETPTPITASDGTPLRGFAHKGEGGAHAHVIDRAVPVRVGDAELFRVDTDAMLDHVALTQRADAPHNPIAIPAGYWEPTVQRVWSPGRRFRFAD